MTNNLEQSLSDRDAVDFEELDVRLDDEVVLDELELIQDERELSELERSIRVIAIFAGLPTASVLRIAIERRREKRRKKQDSGELIENERVIVERNQRERSSLLLAIMTDVFSATVVALPLVLEIINTQSGQESSNLWIVLTAIMVLLRYVWNPTAIVISDAIGEIVAEKVHKIDKPN